MIKDQYNPFLRSGMAALGDLECDACRQTFEALEGKQEAVLARKEAFHSEEYRWPEDALHWWSRVWEYPYIYYHMQRLFEGMPSDQRPVVADIGSGVTFFPFSIAQLGCDLICVDIDPVCRKDLLRAAEVVPQEPGSLDFRLAEGTKLPFEDAECDVIYCVSVLEHIPEFEKTIEEMYRVLKPGGYCLITCDVDLRKGGTMQLTREEFRRLRGAVEGRFEWFLPEQTVHPADILTSLNSPHPWNTVSSLRVGMQYIKHNVLNPMTGKPADFAGRLQLGIMALALRKSDIG